MRIKLNTYSAMVLMILSIFVFGYTIRAATVPSLQYISILFIIGLIIMLRVCDWRINSVKFILFLFFLISTILSDFINHVSIQQWILYFFMNTVSLILFVIDDSRIILSKIEIKKLIKIYNYFVHLIFIIYILDIITGSAIMRFLSTNWLTSISNWVPESGSLFQSRYASYLGHYLFTDVIYLGYYILNIIYKRSFDENINNPILFHTIATIGVISTGSKTGLLVLLLMLILFNFKSLKYMIVLCCGTLVLYFAGFFNILFNRLSTEDFSTGRFAAWQTLFDLKILKLHMFYGIGDNFFGYINNFVDFGVAGIATEFPILCMLFKVGVIGLIAYLVIVLINPLYVLWKNKAWDGIVCIVLLFFTIGTYNGLFAYPDTQIVYSIIVILVMKTIKISERKYRLENGRIEIYNG